MKDDILSSVIFEIYKNFAMFEISVEDGMSELVFFILFKMDTFSVAFLLQWSIWIVTIHKQSSTMVVSIESTTNIFLFFNT